MTARFSTLLRCRSTHALARLAQHLLGEVDAEDAAVARIVGQRDARADADLEDAPADALAGGDRRAPALLEDRAEHEIVDRVPSARRPW